MPSRLPLLLVPFIAAVLSGCSAPDMQELRGLGSAEARHAPYPEIVPTAPLLAQADTSITADDTAAIQAAGAETARRAKLLQNRSLNE